VERSFGSLMYSVELVGGESVKSDEPTGTILGEWN
jgi:hypothetical protein